MEMKNICGRIPLELHAKVRGEIEQREISTQEFLQQVIEEHFMEKGVEQMAARTIAVQVTEELFGRLKEVVARKGCKQKDFLTRIIEKGIAEAEAELEKERQEREALARQQENVQENTEEDLEEADSEEPEENGEPVSELPIEDAETEDMEAESDGSEEADGGEEPEGAIVA